MSVHCILCIYISSQTSIAQRFFHVPKAPFAFPDNQYFQCPMVFLNGNSPLPISPTTNIWRPQWFFCMVTISFAFSPQLTAQTSKCGDNKLRDLLPVIFPGVTSNIQAINTAVYYLCLMLKFPMWNECFTPWWRSTQDSLWWASLI